MIPPAPTFICRYPLAKSGWPLANDQVVYFVVDTMDVRWTGDVPEIVDCEAIDIVAVV